MKNLILMLACAGGLLGQYVIGDRRYEGVQNMGPAAAWIPPTVTSTPTGSCIPENRVVMVTSTGALFRCTLGSWSAISGGGGIASVNGYAGPNVVLNVGDIAGAAAQAGNNTWTGQDDASGATLTKPFRDVAVLPGSCTAGEMMRLTSENRYYGCVNGAPRLLVEPDRRRLVESDEFSWYSAGAAWYSGMGWRSSGNCGGGRTNATSTANHPGIYRMTTAATAFDVCAIVRGGTGGAEYVAGLNGKTFDDIWIIRLGSVITSYSLYVGYLVADTISNTDSLYARFDTAAGDTSFVGRGCAAGSCNNTPTIAATAADGWYTIRIRSLVAGTVLFSACAGDGCTLSAEQAIGSVPSVPMSPGVLLQTATASARSVDIDYYSKVMEIAR